MGERRGSYFHIPKLDFSVFGESMTEEEINAHYMAVENELERDWRKFVDDVEQHPERLVSWDMDISFDEFAKRVRAGEFD